MSLHVMKGLTPHLEPVDLERFTGMWVLGEPLPLLMSAVLRLRLVSLRDGVREVAATMTDDEADALVRAMGRLEVPDGLRPDEEDAHRLVAVVAQTCAAADAAVTRILAQPA